jgi:hypothetical protein
MVRNEAPAHGESRRQQLLLAPVVTAPELYSAHSGPARREANQRFFHLCSFENLSLKYEARHAELPRVSMPRTRFRTDKEQTHELRSRHR